MENMLNYSANTYVCYSEEFQNNLMQEDDKNVIG